MNTTCYPKSLYLFNAIKAEQLFKGLPGIDNWSLTRSIYGSNGAMVDRTNTISTPFNTKNIEWLRMPTMENVFIKSLKQCCHEHARSIIDQSVKENKTITMMWSGGIDSTCMVSSFLSVANLTELERITVLLNKDSILENPDFYRNHLIGKIKCKDSNSWTAYINPSIIFLTGEGGDQLGWFGFTRHSESAFNELGWDFLKMPATSDNIIKCLEKVCQNKEVATVCYERVIDPLRNTAVVDVNTVSQSLWWTIFCVKWQNVYLRIMNNLVDTQHVDTNYMQYNFKMFFQSDDIQRWIMCNNEKALWVNKFTDIKLPLKEIIYQFDKNQNYLENKVKLGSLGRLSLMRPSIGFITSTWDFLDTVDVESYYNKSNSFI
jgi:hypothetical protein